MLLSNIIQSESCNAVLQKKKKMRFLSIFSFCFGMKHKLFGAVYVKKASKVQMFRVTAEWLGHFICGRSGLSSPNQAEQEHPIIRRCFSRHNLCKSCFYVLSSFQLSLLIE